VNRATGLLHGLTVVELASERAAFAGKLLADQGADVILVEPPGGHPTRAYEPYIDDVPGPDRSLWFCHYNTSKRSVIVDLSADAGRSAFLELVRGADVVLEAEGPGVLAALGIDHDSIRAAQPELIWCSVTPFGRDTPRSAERATDLTLIANGGIAWNCGYDDHELPPVRGGGNQAWQTGSLYAVMGLLTAVVHRDATGVGQFVDVSVHAAVNVTTEAGSYEWLVAQTEVQRQTCRHAAAVLTTPVLGTSTDGRSVHTGVPPRFGREYAALVEWMRARGLDTEYDEFFFLEMAAERGGVFVWELGDPECLAMFAAGREAVRFMGERMTASEFFHEGQSRGLAVGIINAPEDVMADPHFQARGFAVEVEHAELGRTLTYPGLPFTGDRARGAIRRAPLLPPSA
jgi:crotonobetainyl-CoA:carnitine CoA-transferase CaiB-like acyl-CoA transferase